MTKDRPQQFPYRGKVGQPVVMRTKGFLREQFKASACQSSIVLQVKVAG